jgi:hypothetical protein
LIARIARWAAAAVVIAAVAWFIMPVQALRVRHAADGRILWRVRVHNGSLVDLNYTNSIYNAATTERFSVYNGHLRPLETSSDKQAVLEYLALDPPYERRGGRVVAKGRNILFAELPIRIGQTGQQRLEVAGRVIPLYEVGTGESVRVAVARVPRLIDLAQARRLRR